MEYAAEGKKNEMELVFDSLSENEGFARVAVAAFMTQMNPILEEVSDVSFRSRYKFDYSRL